LADFENWQNLLTLPNPFKENGWPTIWVECPGLSWEPCWWDGENRKEEALTNVVLENNTTSVLGNHILQVGGNIRWGHHNVRVLQQAQGQHQFYEYWTSQWDPARHWKKSRTGNGLASALLGLGTWHEAHYNRSYFYLREQELGLYANDKWRITPRLTLNLGLR
jgi:hypothetical protein